MADYEELRRKKVEENNRRLLELNIASLSASLRAPDTPNKSSVRRTLKRKAPQVEEVEVRRSRRLAKLPEQHYKEGDEPDQRPTITIRRVRVLYKHRGITGRVYASDEARDYAINKAEELESGLGAKFPSFVKPMLQSRTTGGFWLGLPSYFCNDHLPKKDTPMTLIDEDGDESETLYLAKKNGLSAGWRGFSIEHRLVDGDALVFELIRPTAFNVYIIRASGYNSADDEAAEV